METRQEREQRLIAAISQSAASGRSLPRLNGGDAVVLAELLGLDTASSASRQHYIDTGRYLTKAEVGHTCDDFDDPEDEDRLRCDECGMPADEDGYCTAVDCVRCGKTARVPS